MLRFVSFRQIAWMFFCLAAFGCGSGTDKNSSREAVYPISGKVLYNGAPVASADVTFSCEEKNISAFGRTNAEGIFKLTTYAPNDGAVAGKHIIIVTKIETAAAVDLAADSDAAYVPPGANQSTDPTPPKSSIPAKYGDAKKTDLFATVTAGENPEITVELKD